MKTLVSGLVAILISFAFGAGMAHAENECKPLSTGRTITLSSVVDVDSAYEGTPVSVELRAPLAGSNCIILDWKLEGYGHNPASAADFPGNKWPHGRVHLNAAEGGVSFGYPRAVITFPSIAHQHLTKNRTFRIVLSDPMTHQIIWGRAPAVSIIQNGQISWMNEAHLDRAIFTLYGNPNYCRAEYSADEMRFAGSPSSVGSLPEQSATVERNIQRPIMDCLNVYWRVVASGETVAKHAKLVPVASGTITFPAGGEPVDSFYWSRKIDLRDKEMHNIRIDQAYRIELFNIARPDVVIDSRALLIR